MLHCFWVLFLWICLRPYHFIFNSGKAAISETIRFCHSTSFLIYPYSNWIITWDAHNTSLMAIPLSHRCVAFTYCCFSPLPFYLHIPDQVLRYFIFLLCVSPESIVNYPEKIWTVINIKLRTLTSVEMPPMAQYNVILVHCIQESSKWHMEQKILTQLPLI